MEKAKPLILVTNDDGVLAPGIRALIAVMAEIGEVVVVAPDSPQSATGHSITINDTLYINKISKENDEILEYSCSGTPVDSVKLAVNEILKRKPDLCVSGINHGSNSSINVIYSGTMSAAVEAGIEGIPAIGFSLLDYDWNADFEQIKSFIRTITLEVLENGLPESEGKRYSRHKNLSSSKSNLDGEIRQAKNTARKRLLLAHGRICQSRPR